MAIRKNQMENLRYKYFRLGNDEEKAGNIEKAIEYYLEYSNHLKPNDKHIPFLWIHNLFYSLSDLNLSAKYLLMYCEGCSKPHAILTLKEYSKKYELINPEIAKTLKEQAKKYNK